MKPRLGTRLIVSWCAAFVVIFGLWTWSELREPGQQYAEPLFPCAYVAMLTAPVLTLVWLLFDAAAAWLERR